MHDDYKPLEIPDAYKHIPIEPCPVCNSKPELWQYSESEQAKVTRVMMCGYREPILHEAGLVNEGCLLYMPPDIFYRDTIRDAIRFWNEFSIALRGVRKANEFTPAQQASDYQI